MSPRKIKEENIEEYLRSNTVYDNITDCWLYQNIDKRYGYGIIRFRNKNIGVHRVSAFLYLEYDLNDPVLQVNHSIVCPNPNCWNPSHLYVGTQAQNNYDKILTGTATGWNSSKTHCPKDHEYTPENTRFRKDGARECKTCKKEWDKIHPRSERYIPTPRIK